MRQFTLIVALAGALTLAFGGSASAQYYGRYPRRPAARAAGAAIRGTERAAAAAIRGTERAARAAAPPYARPYAPRVYYGSGPYYGARPYGPRPYVARAPLVWY